MDEVDDYYDDSLRAKNKNDDALDVVSEHSFSFVHPRNVVSDIRTVFQYMKQLGNGASCRVLKAKNIQNHKIYAVKEMSKSQAINALAFTKEVELLQKLYHPNILRYADSFIDDKAYYIST